LRVGAAPAARSRTRLTFSFTDSGVGLTKSEAARLFEPFVQANIDVAQRFGGAGLGLAFVRRIARAMGGDLKMTSAPGRGSTFTLTAPVGNADASAQAAESAIEADRRALQLLCVEDNPYGRVVMNTILTELGHRVDFVGDGIAAVDAVATGHYDAVLMDLTLPSIDGYEATRRIRMLSGPAGRMPVVGISGRSGRRIEEAARGCGMNAYLTKPVSPAQLARVLAGLKI
jgi:CheY-like chemotaxis protein